MIWGQLECGGWNYVFDFAGENSLKSWYDTVGKNGWRLEEFQHYYGNATYDDAGTMEAAKFLLRMYVEKMILLSVRLWRKPLILSWKVNIRWVDGLNGIL